MLSNHVRKVTGFAAAGLLAATVLLPATASVASAAPGGPDTVEVTTDGGTVGPLWLNYGPITQYPAEGGTWEYGFWNAMVRSYYTVGRCHGSTVRMDDRESRSVDTASGQTSIAELWAVQYPGAADSYFYRVC